MPEELLPTPQTDLPLPEKEIPAHATPQGQALQNKKTNIFKSKFFLGFVAFSILIAFLIGGFALGKNSVFKELNPTIPSIPPKDPVVYDPTADWKTYTGNGYSFKYPSGWAINAEKPTAIVIGPLSTKNHIGETVQGYVSPYITLTLKESTPNTDLIEYSKLDASLGAVWENITIDNLIGFDATHTGCQSSSCRDIFFQNGKTIYNFSEQNKLKELNSIITTFKFD